MAADPVRLTPMSIERAQICIRAAELRALHKTWPQIAAALGLPSPLHAKKAIETGLALIPAEDVRTVRRMCADELHTLAREALEIIGNPGPMTTVSGKLVIDEETGKPYPDQQARNNALRTLLDINRELRKLYGADAPKQSVKWFAALSADEIRGMVAEVQAQAEEAERETLRVVPEIEAASGDSAG